MNKSIYNNKLRAAKRRIFDYLKREGININGTKHRKLISVFLNMNDIQRPIEMRWQDVIIKLYENGELPECTPKPKKQRMPVDKFKQEYIDYLNSKKWKEFRLKALDHFGHRCGLCDRSDNLQLHHKHYRTIFNETFNDVIPLCYKCHKIHHGK